VSVNAIAMSCVSVHFMAARSSLVAQWLSGFPSRG
jgi:hypothetical protein